MSQEVKQGNVVINCDRPTPGMFSWNIQRHTGQFPHVDIVLSLFDGYNHPSSFDFGLWNDELNSRQAWARYISQMYAIQHELDNLIFSVEATYDEHFKELEDESSD